MIPAGLAHRRLILSRVFEIRSRAKPSVQFLGTSSAHVCPDPGHMSPGSLRSVPVAAPSVQGKPCKARNERWTGHPHRESPRASVSASPVIIYYNACLKTQSDRLLERIELERRLADAYARIREMIRKIDS